MKMIIGGAFQGKTLLAKKIYPDIDWINGADADHLIGRIVKQLAEYVRSLPHTARR